MDSHFILDERLDRDCYTLGQWQDCLVLLMNNSLAPWLILVPETDHIEFFQLPYKQQLSVLDKINRLSEILIHNFDIDKLNIATIGNIVSQLHVHIIGRSIDDYCWPSTCWGNADQTPYSEQQLTQISNILKKNIKDQYNALPLKLKETY